MVKLTYLFVILAIILTQFTFEQIECWILPNKGNILSNTSTSSPSSSSLLSSLKSSSRPSPLPLESFSSSLWTLSSVESPLNELPSSPSASVSSIVKSNILSLNVEPKVEREKSKSKNFLHHQKSTRRAKRSDQEASVNEVKEIKIVAGQSLRVHCRLQQVTGQLTLTVETSSDVLPAEPAKSELSYTFLDEVYWFKGKSTGQTGHLCSTNFQLS